MIFFRYMVVLILGIVIGVLLGSEGRKLPILAVFMDAPELSEPSASALLMGSEGVSFDASVLPRSTADVEVAVSVAQSSARQNQIEPRVAVDRIDDRDEKIDLTTLWRQRDFRSLVMRITYDVERIPALERDALVREMVLVLLRSMNPKELPSDVQSVFVAYADALPHDPVIQLWSILHIDRFAFPEQVITELDALSSYYQTQIDMAQIQQLRTALITQVENQFRQQHQLQKLQDWYQWLAVRERDSELWVYKLAVLYVDQEEYQQAILILDQRAVFPNYADEVSRLRESVAAALEIDYSSLPLQRYGEQYLVALDIVGYGKVNLLLDTGASLTLLSQDAAQRIRLPQAGTPLQLATAGGTAKAFSVPVQGVRLHRYFIALAQLAFIDQALPADGLLGMDVLSRFRFFVDQENAVLRIKPR